jgi:type I restriction enzyme M protein
MQVKKPVNFLLQKKFLPLLAKLTKSKPGSRICDPTCGSGSLLIKAGEEVGSDNFSLYGQEANGSTWALAVMNMFLHGFDNATIRWGDTIRNPKLKEGDALMKFDTVVANPPFQFRQMGKSRRQGRRTKPPIVSTLKPINTIDFGEAYRPKAKATGHLSAT